MSLNYRLPLDQKLSLDDQIQELYLLHIIVLYWWFVNRAW